MVQAEIEVSIFCYCSKQKNCNLCTWEIKEAVLSNTKALEMKCRCSFTRNCPVGEVMVTGKTFQQEGFDNKDIR